ncbi:MAG: nicotinate (nicotinamide) nucleotide adenylyltransferase [Clostridia bacterium]|nr:nicotinate (nicotinamide) nucleotide adenylyltransferase [Clostridia bacterium]
MDNISALGIYGGTFSPPHDGHLNAINAFLSEVDLDKLLIMPAKLPPHKIIDPHDKPEHRLAMTRLMLCDHPEWNSRLSVCDWEINQSEKSYTVYTLRHFKECADKLYFLMGTDMLLSLHEWYMPEEICRLCNIAFMRREQSGAEIDKKIEDQIKFLIKEFGAKIIELSSRVLPLDSTSVRSALAHGEHPAGIRPAVYDYIKQNRLYGS